MIDTMMNRRSCRRFQNRPVTREQLMTLMELARRAPSGANRQPMKYLAVTEGETLNRIHPHVHWAAYTAPLGGPKSDDERPRAYICLLADTAIKPDCAQDEGIAGAAITYGAEALGLSTCWLGAIDRKEICQILNIPEGMKLMSMIALGYAAQERVLETGEDVKYWLEGEVVHVPKRPAEQVMFFDRMNG